MSMFSLSDRLKAAVNNLEATGAQLQARAIGQQSQSQSQVPRSTSPNASTSPSTSASIIKSPPPISTSPIASPTISTVGERQTSPTKTTASNHAHYVSSTSQLAENALSGLRKSFNFARDGPIRPASAASSSPTTTTGLANGTEAKELKDITSPTTQTTSISRPSSPSPGRFLPNLGASGAAFSLGSDPSSLVNTPRPRSPAFASTIGSSSLAASTPSARPHSPVLPSPDPSDPATYPLPPSPVLAASPLLAPAPQMAYADPLGASPMLDALEKAEPPILGLQAPTPVEEKPESLGGLGVTGMDATEKEGAEVIVTPEVDGTEAADADLHHDKEEPEEKNEGANPDKDDSAAYIKLRAQADEANRVLRELTPLEGGIEDAGALEGWVRMMKGKVDMITDEMKRLQDKITLQDSRMEELRDTHRLEGTSQSELVSKLRSQLSTAESNLASRASELMALGQLRADLSKAQTQAKEEEEKRTKAVSLLKTVRMKLVKAEKDKEEVEQDRAEERAERSRAVEEVERVKAERERDINSLRKGFERELAGAKERYEKDLQAKKAAWELEMITTKAAHAKEISGKSTKVAGLELIVKELNTSKQQQFELLEAKQAEVESSRAEMETLQNRTKDLEFQLRETSERCAILEDQAHMVSPVRGRHLAVGLESRSARSTPDPSPSRQNSYSSTSAAELQRVLAEAEARSEAKLSDLRFKIRSLENERNELEEEWAHKLQERVNEMEKLRRVITEKESEYSDSLRSSRDKEDRIAAVEDQKRGLERELMAMRAKVEEVRGDVSVSAEAERSAREEVSNLNLQISSLQSQLEDAKNLSTQLRSANKTLRDELRKVQSSVNLMERSRNPGVGYWSANANPGNAATGGAGPSHSNASILSGVTSPISENASAVTTPTKDPRERDRDFRKSLESLDRGGRASISMSMSGVSSPAPSEVNKDEEEVNLEYLRNVILQFLEHKEMRPNLVRVLSVILRFTPQELRRLNAKLLT